MENETAQKIELEEEASLASKKKGKSKEETTDTGKLYRQFCREIQLYEKRFDKWHHKASQIEGIYNNKRPGGGTYTYNSLKSNVNIQRPALFSNLPKVVCERRFKDTDPIARVASRIAERATTFSLDIEKNDFTDTVHSLVLDRLLVARGVTWVRIEAEQTRPVLDADGNETNEEEIIQDANAKTDYVPWRDFGHTPEARRWGEVRAVWRRVYLTKKEFKDRFKVGEKDFANDTYDVPEEIREQFGEADQDSANLIAVYERWDKEKKRVYWFTKNIPDKFLQTLNDPLRLMNFFPCPKPLYGDLTNTSLEPTPDYCSYETLADDLDYVTERKADLTEMVKLVGVHDASINEAMIKLSSLADGDSIPIKNWQVFADKGGLRNTMQWLPIKEVADTINTLTAIQGDLLSKIYDIASISDILRGQGGGQYETAEQTRTKTQFATQTFSAKQRDVQRLIAEVLQMKAEIIFDDPLIFPDELIYHMAGIEGFTPEDKQLVPQALMLLRSDRWRTFKVTIETDSTIAIDEQANKEMINDFVTSIGQLAQTMTPLIQTMPQLQTFYIELVKFASRHYRAARGLEGALEGVLDQVIQAQQEAQGKPDPQVQMEQQKMEMAQFKLQTETQLAQAEFQLEIQKAEAQREIDTFKAQSAIQAKQEKLESTAVINQAKFQLELMKIELQKQKLEQDAMLAERQQLLDATVEGTKAAEMKDRRPEQPTQR